MTTIARTTNPLLVKKRNQIIAALAANPNPTQVAKEFGVSSRTVYRIAKAEGIKLKVSALGRPTRLQSDRRAAIIEALKANSNAKLVASEIGDVSQNTVGKIAQAEGIKLTAGKGAGGRPPLSPDRRAAVIEGLRDSPNAAQVSREIGVGYETVRKIAKAEGVELPGSKAVSGRPSRKGDN